MTIYLAPGILVAMAVLAFFPLVYAGVFLAILCNALLELTRLSVMRWVSVIPIFTCVAIWFIAVRWAFDVYDQSARSALLVLGIALG